MSNLMLHCGATPMTIDQLKAMSSDHYQPLTPTHKPVAHYRVADMIRQSLNRFSKSYSIVEEQYGVSGKKGTGSRYHRGSDDVLAVIGNVEWARSNERPTPRGGATVP